MDLHQIVIFATFLSLWASSSADNERMVSTSETILIPMAFETKITCEMNIQPDKFQWKFYPFSEKDALHNKTSISLTSSRFDLVPSYKYGNNVTMTTQKKESTLTIKTNKHLAGDYQCLAYYGAFVVASVPWRIIIITLDNLPITRSTITNVTVLEGNTVNWRCDIPEGKGLYIDYLKNRAYVPPMEPLAKHILRIPNASPRDSGRYKCRVGNVIDQVILNTELDLRVTRSYMEERPRFIIPPKRIYTVVQGDSVFIECAAVGSPVPNVDWRKHGGSISRERSEMVKGGLIIRNITASDDGTYECHYKNKFDSISAKIILSYNESPKIDCSSHSPVDVTQGQNLDLECAITGTPEPEISWFLNGFSVMNDSEIEAIRNKIYFRSVEKRHAGNLQIFARNVVNTVYKSISIRVIPLPTVQDTNSDNTATTPRRNHKGSGRKTTRLHGKMVPPSKPSVVRLNDEAVVVRWNVSMKHGLSIKFFKVQYRELGPGNSHDHPSKGKGSKWNTIDDDIAPTMRLKEVNNLKPDYWYRFRIAAVYTNDDNKNSPNSEKFFLKKMDFDIKNPLPIPMITKTETINSSAVGIHWKYDPSTNVSVAGFFVMYNSASSAADYSRAAVDDPHARSFVLGNLQASTFYDIKMQSFFKDLTSEFSSIMKANTAAEVTVTTPPTTSSSIPVTETPGLSNLYMVIAGGVLGAFGIIIGVIVLLLFCRKWKQNKNGDSDKSGVDEHHIQADGNDYVVGTKSLQRSNGCIAPNRITITANPLADADNKNQNMIEMSCLSSQNNNCTQASASGDDSSNAKNNKSREQRVRKKHDNPSGENYV